MAPLAVWVAFGLGVVNLATFAVFWWDKRRAQVGGRRIPERTLLLCALAGGSVGARIAQRRFRHKIRKQPFAVVLNAIVALHVAAALALALSGPRAAVLSYLKTFIDAQTGAFTS